MDRRAGRRRATRCFSDCPSSQCPPGRDRHGGAGPVATATVPGPGATPTAANRSRRRRDTRWHRFDRRKGADRGTGRPVKRARVPFPQADASQHDEHRRSRTISNRRPCGRVLHRHRLQERLRQRDLRSTSAASAGHTCGVRRRTGDRESSICGLTRGGVITGRVLDEDGEALSRAIVAVERYQYVRGERQLVAAGGGPDGRSRPVSGVRACPRRLLRQRDDARVWPRAWDEGCSNSPWREAAADGVFRRRADESASVGYAPTYYPGVVNAAEARKVTVGPGQEAGGHRFPGTAGCDGDGARVRHGSRQPGIGPPGSAGKRRCPSRSDSPRRLSGRRQLHDRATCRPDTIRLSRDRVGGEAQTRSAARPSTSPATT